MKRPAWADLPNAKHIDRIIADLKLNPGAWFTAQTSARDAARTAAWDAARNAANAIYNAVNNAAWTAAWDAAWDAILALVVYDDYAYLLDEKPEHVQILALLGNQQAILLYPACVALHQKEREIA